MKEATTMKEYLLGKKKENGRGRARKKYFRRLFFE